MDTVIVTGSPLMKRARFDRRAQHLARGQSIRQR